MKQVKTMGLCMKLKKSSRKGKLCKAMIFKNFVIEILPVLAMIVATVAIRLGSSKMVRRLGLISSPLWLTYNCFSGSIGAIASEILNLISIIVGIIRLDLRKKKNDKVA